MVVWCVDIGRRIMSITWKHIIISEESEIKIAWELKEKVYQIEWRQQVKSQLKCRKIENWIEAKWLSLKWESELNWIELFGERKATPLSKGRDLTIEMKELIKVWSENWNNIVRTWCPWVRSVLSNEIELIEEEKSPS